MSFSLSSSPYYNLFCSRGLKVVFPSALFLREELDQEEKAKFGEYCSSESGKGREWFARYVSAQVRAGDGEETGGALHPSCLFNSSLWRQESREMTQQKKGKKPHLSKDVLKRPIKDSGT